MTWRRCGRLTLSFLMAYVAVAPSARAQSTPPPLLERLVGRWVLQGTIDGQATTHDVDADLVLNRGYARLHEVSREKDKGGAPAYEAMIFISRDAKTGEYSCLWLDNTSNTGLSSGIVAHATATDNALPFIFNFGNNHVFRTTFTYTPRTDSWEWRMDDDQNGKLTAFARVTLARRR